MAGRGAYLHNQTSCWERGLKGALAHALKTVLTEEEQERLSAFAETLDTEVMDKDSGDKP
jgi:hypothetical protein